MSRELKGNMVFDAGPILELVYSSPGGVTAKEALKEGRIHCDTCELIMAEVRYILCRRLGAKESKERVESLLESGYLTVHPDSELVEPASECKCDRSISLPDCFSLGLARKLQVPALFSRREDDLAKEMGRKPFDIEIIFLQDFTQANDSAGSRGAR